jgi:hypothetical protein
MSAGGVQRIVEDGTRAHVMDVTALHATSNNVATDHVDTTFDALRHLCVNNLKVDITRDETGGVAPAPRIKIKTAERTLLYVCETYVSRRLRTKIAASLRGICAPF